MAHFLNLTKNYAFYTSENHTDFYLKNEMLFDITIKRLS